MIEILVIIAIIWLHTFADFVFQGRYIGNNKGKKPHVLALHCIIYGVLYLFIDPLFAIVNGVLHFPVDYISSKLTGYFWKKKKEYLFFTTIGIDQALHYTILFLTYGLLVL